MFTNNSPLEQTALDPDGNPLADEKPAGKHLMEPRDVFMHIRLYRR